MKKVLLSIMLIVSVSFVYSAELDKYSDYAYINHPEVYLSIQKMVCEYEREDFDNAVNLMNMQCFSLYACMSVYESGGLPMKAVDLLHMMYNSSADMETVNWVMVLKELDRITNEGIVNLE